MLQLSQIWIYPIKSLGGICLEKSKITLRGLEHDRRWMLVDQNGIFITQREHPQLALFQPSIQGNLMTINHQDLGWGRVQFSLSQKNNSALIDVLVWEDAVKAQEVSPEISAWFAQILGFSVRLVYMPHESLRPVDPAYAVSPTNHTSLSDGFPFLIIGQASLDDLNGRLKNPISMKRFRPNFVFTGGVAYEEEIWTKFTIGTQLFYGVKPSGRCTITTVDPNTGKQSGHEPLLTLSTYKKVGNKVIFGQNLIAHQEGAIAVGDAILVC